MIITTSYLANTLLVHQARKLAKQLHGSYIERGKRSIQQLMAYYHTYEIVVVEQKHTKYYQTDELHPFFFHPNMAILRINRLKQGDNDVMAQIAGLKQGDTFLDCTMGMASDALVAASIVGDTGKVLAFESEPLLTVLVKDGLKKGWDKDIDIDRAMKRIEVQNIDHMEGLRMLPDHSFDVVYFDPMFRQGIKKSSPFKPIRTLANKRHIMIESINEAKRVAKRKVILKENRLSSEFERLGFYQIPRSSTVTYGVIDVNGDDMP